MGYCIYTGASVVLEDAKQKSGSASATMQTFIRALNTGMRRCPLLERSLNIIIKGLQAVPVNRDVSDNAFMLNSYIPAFPYLDSLGASYTDMYPDMSGTSMEAMEMLDCFPELQIGVGDLICSETL
jgi:hypothetical protein